ncbi:hypothetical protein Tsp_02211 [Trichinella spiralis]|uniref:hypothetical protein n=1 Tax=Trichinella spiralis TaxID=6334 RepID=UPI0001EFC6BD|nr:hypothetical protein Tsp_02211 [Trichinella spiralis]
MVSVMGSAMGSTTADGHGSCWSHNGGRTPFRSMRVVRIFLFFVYPALSRRNYLQSLLLRCQGGCGREPFAVGASLAVQPDFSRLWHKVSRVVKIRNSLDAVSSFREPFFAKLLLSCGPFSLLVRLMPDETGQF